MKRECCDKCGRELKIQPTPVHSGQVTPGRTPSVVTKLVCEEHGIHSIIGTLFEEAKLYYEILE